jgi:hypothetical protein
MSEQQQQPVAAEPETQQPTEAPASETPAEEAVTFDGWYKTLDATTQGLVDDHIDGLRSALNTERGERKTLEKRLRDLSKQAEQGQDIQQQLQQVTEQMAQASAQATFFEAAHAANVRNLRLAWLAATDAGLVNKKTGEVDFGELRKVAPEVFASRTIPPADPGAGAQQNGVSKPSMNDFLRAAAGRG